MSSSRPQFQNEHPDLQESKTPPLNSNNSRPSITIDPNLPFYCNGPLPQSRILEFQAESQNSIEKREITPNNTDLPELGKTLAQRTRLSLLSTMSNDSPRFTPQSSNGSDGARLTNNFDSASSHFRRTSGVERPRNSSFMNAGSQGNSGNIGTSAFSAVSRNEFAGPVQNQQADRTIFSGDTANQMMMVRVIFNSLRMSQILITYFRNRNARVSFSQAFYTQAASLDLNSATNSPIINELLQRVEQEEIRRHLLGRRKDTPHLSKDQQLGIAMQCNRLLMGLVSSAEECEISQTLDHAKQELKIYTAQDELIAVLREIANPDQIILVGNPRGKFRKTGEPFTSSEYRGVCKNGSKYQMFIMIDGKKKMYQGGYDSAQDAGRAYDQAAIQMRGIKARTNFSYTKQETEEILYRPPIFKVYKPRWGNYGI